MQERNKPDSPKNGVYFFQAGAGDGAQWINPRNENLDTRRTFQTLPSTRVIFSCCEKIAPKRGGMDSKNSMRETLSSISGSSRYKPRSDTTI